MRGFHTWVCRRLCVVWGNSYILAQWLRGSEWTGTLVWEPCGKDWLLWLGLSQLLLWLPLIESLQVSH